MQKLPCRASWLQLDLARPLHSPTSGGVPPGASSERHSGSPLMLLLFWSLPGGPCQQQKILIHSCTAMQASSLVPKAHPKLVNKTDAESPRPAKVFRDDGIVHMLTEHLLQSICEHTPCQQLHHTLRDSSALAICINEAVCGFTLRPGIDKQFRSTTTSPRPILIGGPPNHENVFEGVPHSCKGCRRVDDKHLACNQVIPHAWHGQQRGSKEGPYHFPWGQVARRADLGTV